MPPKSKWWTYFERLDRDRAKCKTCLHVLKTCGNTSNLKNHVEKLHISLLKSVTVAPVSTSLIDDPSGEFDDTPSCSAPKKKKIVLTDPTRKPSMSPLPATSSPTDTHGHSRPKSIKESFQHVIQFLPGGNKYNEVTGAIVYMLCKDNLPFTTVEKTGFKKFLKVVAPQYKPASRITVKKMVEDKFEFAKNEFKKKFMNINTFSLTTDVWTDTMQTRSFLGVTIHFPEEEKLASCTLGVVQLEKSHTSEYISEQLDKYLKEWGLCKKNLHCAITDGAVNMTKAIELSFGKKSHLWCFAHILNLVAQRSLENTQLLTLLSKVKMIVTWFKRSVRANDELRKCGSDVKLIQEVETRWNSKYFMIKRFLTLSLHINNIILLHTSAPLMTTATENEQLKEIQEVLKPLAMATNDMSGELYMTSSMAIPVSSMLRDRINELNPKTEIAKTLKQSLIDEIDKRLGSIEFVPQLAIATLLDPRYKNVYFKKPEAVARAINDIKKLLEQQSSQSPTLSTGSASDSSSSEDTCSKSKKKKDSLFNDHSRNVQKHWKTSSKSYSGFDSGMPDHLVLYLKAPAECDLKKCPISYWSSMSPSCPQLAEIGIHYVASVATSVTSERLFSKAGLILTQERNRLKGEILSKLLFLQSVPEEYFFCA